MSEALKKMANEYRASAKLLLNRICELKEELAQTECFPGNWTRLHSRIMSLSGIYAELMATARYLERYHIE